MRPASEHTIRLAAGCCLLMLLAGCAKPPRIGYYLSSPRSLWRIRRVVFVQLNAPDGYPRVAEETTDALFRALQDKQLFHLDVIDRTDPACQDLPLESREAYTIEQLSAMRKSLGCDAILFGTVTGFQAYPRRRLGLYMRLLDLKDGRLVWAVDHNWDTTDKATERRIRRHVSSEMRSGYNPVRWRMGLLSPKSFQKFVAHEVTETLPERPPPGRGRARPKRRPRLSARQKPRNIDKS